MKGDEVVADGNDRRCLCGFKGAVLQGWVNWSGREECKCAEDKDTKLQTAANTALRRLSLIGRCPVVRSRVRVRGEQV